MEETVGPLFTVQHPGLQDINLEQCEQVDGNFDRPGFEPTEFGCEWHRSEYMPPKDSSFRLTFQGAGGPAAAGGAARRLWLWLHVRLWFGSASEGEGAAAGATGAVTTPTGGFGGFGSGLKGGFRGFGAGSTGTTASGSSFDSAASAGVGGWHAALASSPPRQPAHKERTNRAIGLH